MPKNIIKISPKKTTSASKVAKKLLKKLFNRKRLEHENKEL
jgi:hypothetical protein